MSDRSSVRRWSTVATLAAVLALALSATLAGFGTATPITLAPSTPTPVAPLAAARGAVLPDRSTALASRPVGPDGRLAPDATRATDTPASEDVPAPSPVPSPTASTSPADRSGASEDRDAPGPKPAREPKERSKDTKGSARGSTAPTALRGRDRVWIPSLGIKGAVAAYACSNKSYPEDRIYRWGCAGDNNVYLFGHAYSVFKPLHDAYVKDRLRKGQELFYADGSGKVRRYTIAWWKVTTPTKGTWAYAAQSEPSVTLQTCVGSRSQFRLIVRLRQDD